MVETANCPACGYPRAFATEKCIRCGARFPDADPGTPEVIADLPEPSAQAVAAPETAPMCVNHPTVPSSVRCDQCGVNICSTCALRVSPPESSDSILNIGRDTHVCPNCMMTRGSSSPLYPQPFPPQPLPGGVMCTHHPDVSAVRRCALCTAVMCGTCDFEFPGHFHLCPTCATNPTTALSPRRKKLIGFAYALAVWSTLAIAVLFSGVLVAEDQGQQEAIELAAGLLIFTPTLGGTALSFSALDKRLGNPPVVWGAVIWNGILLAVWVILSVIGSLM